MKKRIIFVALAIALLGLEVQKSNTIELESNKIEKATLCSKEYEILDTKTDGTDDYAFHSKIYEDAGCFTLNQK